MNMENLICIHIEREKVGDDPMSLCTLLGALRNGFFRKFKSAWGFHVRDLKTNLGPSLLPLKWATIRLQNQHRKKKELKRLVQ